MPARLPDLTVEHRDALANVALRSAELDVTIEWATMFAMADTERAGKYVLANVSGERVLNLLGALLIDRFPDEEVSIEAMVARIAECRRERNELMHWLWEQSDDPTNVQLLLLRPHREARVQLKTAPDIMTVANTMADLSDDLRRWGTRAAQAILESLRETRDLRVLLERSPKPSDGDQKETPEPPDPPPRPSQG